ncbi:MAG: flagellar protein FliT [Candidatus Riflebacteria bacterium]|nr:flagellar protein FliT [Candidatus Riflebacteria bacterium]
MKNQKTSLDDLLKTLNVTVSKLLEANAKFISIQPSYEKFEALTSERAILLDDFNFLVKTALPILSPSIPQESLAAPSIGDLISLLSEKQSQSEEAILLKERMQALTKSDKEIAELMNKAKEALQKKIGDLQNTSKGLKAYKTPNPHGSQFIDKTR